MSRNKVSTTIYLEPKQLAALHELTKRTSVPMAVWIRRGLDSVLAVMAPAAAEVVAGADEKAVRT